MDDILLVTSKAQSWDKQRFLNRFQNECYSKPLTLEKGKESTFLETTFESDGKTFCEYRLKNDNEITTKVWRYHHFKSSLPSTMKRATLLSTLRKVDRMSSGGQLYHSALAKLDEFSRLGYPVGIRKFMCAILARDTSNTIWRYVRSRQV